ncbi:uncharacterized protein [Epargyreus clarus]|uniref:uncharacterized protein n=1 Tax=Epargyreus clarus TaxID=520877 RepID=UPI003C2BDB4E
MHNAVIQNDLEGFMKLTADPVPPQAFSSRDTNNMTVMHKAAGLGHGSILKYIIEKYPQGINDVDNDGRTPLHYAATVKDEQHTYNILVDAGADESVVDNKNKTPGYYVNRSQEIDKSLLKTLPEAPRTPSSVYPSSWDWKLLSTEFIADLNKKSRKKIKASNENISSKKTTTSTVSDSLENHTSAMKGSSTHELISNLPELDDTEKPQVEDTTDKDIHESEEHHEPTEEIDDGTHEQEEEAASENEENNTAAVENAEDDANPDDAEHKEHVEETDKPELAEQNEPEKVDETSEPVTENQDEPDNDKEVNNENESQKNEESTEDHKENETETSNEPNEEKHPDEAAENENLETEPQEPPDEKDPNSPIDHNENKEDESTDDQENKHDIEKSSEEVETTDENNKQNGHDTNETENLNEDVKEDEGEVKATGDEGKLNHGRNSQESLIEGIISGEAEQDSQDASMTHRGETVQGDILIVDNEIDPEVTELINTTNMEMLATLVLNGEGSRLLGRRSENSELQAFLDNVPIYMQKINKVHLAAKEGNIRDLQAALDRRKFAIARDPVSPNGATPLHVATVFGKTNIIKYLGGRFPETLSAVDFEGRTALHYAAVLPDNGHYYNLLQQLGANSKDLDDNGRSAEDYYKNPHLLPFNQLLMDYGISEEAAKNMLSDKGLNHASNGHMDIPIFHTDEGRYLAKSLGDPLIKGLTEVANVKPKDPIAFLASFLHNFPDQEKPRLGTQESNTLITEEAFEVENEQPPPAPIDSPEIEGEHRVRSAARTATRPHRPIDVITVEPQADISPDAPEAAFSSANRDEHGQSMLHFAAARAHTNNALFQLLQESDVSFGYRDELYRTARDVSIQANVPENTVEIDKWVLHLAARGQTDKIMELLLQGYDHILDVADEEGVSITDVVTQRGDSDMSNLLASIPAFEESRESLHDAIRRGDLQSVQDSVAAEGGKTLACGQNAYGRTSLHVAVLAEHEDIVAHLAETCPELLRIGDNLERSPLHYAMGVDKIESLSRILIRAGAKRVLKDLKGRQPSYYFMNKSDILRLKEEESDR